MVEEKIEVPDDDDNQDQLPGGRSWSGMRGWGMEWVGDVEWIYKRRMRNMSSFIYR